MTEKDITLYKANELGKGFPFALIKSKNSRQQ